MKVLGIDPGTRHLGWGVVEKVGSRLTHIAHGTISPKESLPLADRLVILEEGLIAVLEKHAPREAAAETIFFAKDAQAAAKLGHARGVALLACAREGLTIAEYPPARVKRTVAGIGRAEKAQVAQMVKAILKLPEVPQADAADALAVAITHLQNTLTGRIQTGIKAVIKEFNQRRPKAV